MGWEWLGSSYDRVAETYQAAFLDELDDKPRDRELLATFATSVGDPIVEIGCGPGQVGSFVRRRGRDVVGIDLSFEMARLAAERLDAAAAADMRSLPVATGSAGGVLAFYSLIHLPRPEIGAALGEIHRVLRPGGRVLLSAHEGAGEIHHDDFLGEGVPFVATLFELDELTETATHAGLEVTFAERRPPYPTEGSTTRLYVEAERPDQP